MSLNYSHKNYGQRAPLNNNNNNNNRQRPMYHYLYGSVDENNHSHGLNANTAMDSGMSHPTVVPGTPPVPPPSSPVTKTRSSGSSLLSPGGGDLDSLVGEALIATDTEDEGLHPRDGRGDFEQLLLSNGNDNGPSSFLSGRNRKDGGFRASSSGGSSKGVGRKVMSAPTSAATAATTCSGPAICFASFLAVLLLLSSFFVVYFIFPPHDTGKRWHSSGSTSSVDTIPGATTGPPASEMSFKMTFPRVDRATFQDPAESFLLTKLIHPNLMYQGNDPYRIFSFPFPTGAFWTNLILSPTADRGLSYPIFAYPYGFQWSDYLFHVSYPYSHRIEEPKAIHDYFFPDLKFSCNETVLARHITAFDPLSVTLQFDTAKKGLWTVYLVQGSPYVNMEFGSVTPIIRALSTFDALDCPPSANVSLVGDDGSGGYFRARRKLSYGVCESFVDDSARYKSVHGVQFILRTSEGYNWILFTSEPMTWMFDTIIRTTVTATEPYNGAFRAAIIPSKGMNMSDLSKSTGMQRLINHAGIYPIHGEVSWVFGTESQAATMINTLSDLASLPSSSSTKPNEKRIASISLKFLTRSFAPSSGAPNSVKPLLMLALPHHAKRLPSNVLLNADAFDLNFRTIKGQMTPVIGAAWTYVQSLISPGFDSDSGSNGQKFFMNPVIKAALLENLKEDINLALPVRSENIYGYGKQSARLAQLAYIAKRIVSGETRTKTDMNTTGTETSTPQSSLAKALLDKATKLLNSSLEAILTGSVSDSLLYDANLGGMVTKDGLLDAGGDFGNGRYNDHHFHYGYLLYACAIMGKLDPSFVSKYRFHVDAIYYDVAHDSNFDSRRRGEGVFFPGARHMNWFDGHSYASGLFPFGNGKSQESSSEAVNCYYGAYLWSVVRNGAANDPESDKSFETDFARLLLTFEITGAQTYWHMMPSPSVSVTSPQSNQTIKTNVSTTVAPTRPRIYSEQFVGNYMVGNVGMNDVVCSTWFGTDPLYVHMINFLPVTAVAGELFGADYAAAEYEHALASLGQVEMAWRGFVVADHAISDPNAAWEEAKELFSPTLDSGLSKTQVLYFISTRKGFVPPSWNTSNDQGQSGDNLPPEQTGDSSFESTGGSDSCVQNAICASNGLVGMCCPTASGVMLDCC